MTDAVPALGAPQNGASAIARAPSSAPTGADKTAMEFEAAMLTSFVEPLLPSEDSAIWGGSSSRLWRGLFAQEIAGEIARAGGIGLADVVRPSLAADEADAPADATPDVTLQRPIARSSMTDTAPTAPPGLVADGPPTSLAAMNGLKGDR